MGDRAYQWARRIYDAPDDSDGTALGEIRLTGAMLWWIAVAIGSLILFALVRLILGLTVWTGFAEISVQSPPRWTRTPFSINATGSEAGVSKLVPAMSGQQLVIDYELEGKDFRRTSGRAAARITVTCLCPSSNWATFTVHAAGKGQFIKPVGACSIYSVDVYQAPQSDGSKSIGQYYWGVRQAQ